MALLQPAHFFHTLPLLEHTRTWLWAAVLILALTGISAVRQDAILKGGNTSTPAIDFNNTPSGGDGSGGNGPIISKGGFSAAPVSGGGEAAPFDAGTTPPIQPSDPPADISTTWTIALLAATVVVLGWFILTIILSEVSLFNGRAPSLGHNFQIAIWTSIPFALMAVLQLIYFAAGGKAGGAGVSGLLADWEGYKTLPVFWQSLMLSFTSRLTLFWLWSLILIYIAARNALRGKRWSSALVVVVWAILLIVVPVVTGAVKAPDVQSEMTLPELNTIPTPDFTGTSNNNPTGAGLETTPEAGNLTEPLPSAGGRNLLPTEAAPSSKATSVPSTGKG